MLLQGSVNCSAARIKFAFALILHFNYFINTLSWNTLSWRPSKKVKLIPEQLVLNISPLTWTGLNFSVLVMGFDLVFLVHVLCVCLFVFFVTVGVTLVLLFCV